MHRAALLFLVLFIVSCALPQAQDVPPPYPDGGTLYVFEGGQDEVEDILHLPGPASPPPQAIRIGEQRVQILFREARAGTGLRFQRAQAVPLRHPRRTTVAPVREERLYLGLRLDVTPRLLEDGANAAELDVKLRHPAGLSSDGPDLIFCDEKAPVHVPGAIAFKVARWKGRFNLILLQIATIER